MVAKSKHPALIVHPDHPKTEVNTWQLGRAIWNTPDGAVSGEWSALHVASGLARENRGDIQTGFFDPRTAEVREANRIGAEIANANNHLARDSE